jgi:hypothetical protein
MHAFYFAPVKLIEVRPLLPNPHSDLRHALRVLRRGPGFTITAVLVLALATGATTAIFSVIQAVLLRPLPYRDAERLCVLWKTAPARNIEWDWTSYPTIRDWSEQSHVFGDVAFVLRPEASFVLSPGREADSRSWFPSRGRSTGRSARSSH